MKKRVLIIEDEQVLIKALELAFSPEDFSLRIAGDGLAGLELARKIKPDLILLSIILPRLSGFEVLKRLKADKELKQIPVLIISSLGNKTDVNKGIEMGAVDYLIKTKCGVNVIIDRAKQILTATV